MTKFMLEKIDGKLDEVLGRQELDSKNIEKCKTEYIQLKMGEYPSDDAIFAQLGKYYTADTVIEVRHQMRSDLVHETPLIRAIKELLIIIRTSGYRTEERTRALYLWESHYGSDVQIKAVKFVQESGWVSKTESKSE